MRTITLVVESPSVPPAEHTCSAAAPLTFGRATDAGVSCPDSSMSRHHARVAADGDDFFVEDLGSRNGTHVNGEAVRGRRRLAQGDVIKMGATIVRVVDPPAAPSVQTQVGALGGGALGSSIFRSISDLLPDDLADAGVAGAPARVAARLKALNDFHRALAGPISLPELLDLLLDRLFAVLRPEEGLILLRQPDGTLQTAASRRLPGATGELLVSQRLTTEVMERGTAALVTDVAIDERFAEAQSVVAAGVRSILAAPLSDAAGCVGMVAVYSRTSVRRFSEEDLELLVSLASAAALRIRNVELAEEAAARRVHDRELALAHDIQMAMLPRQTPARAEIEMAAALIPARAVGGDLYDFLVIGDTLWFIVADAAGKGVSAALFMAVTRTLLRGVVSENAAVSMVVERMNRELARDNEQQVFVTALVGRLALTSGELTCCSAGHPPMLRGRRQRPTDALPSGAPGIALGVLEDAPYQEERITLQPGDVLLVFTDGVTEAVNGAGELFSDPRLLQAFEEAAAGSATDIVSAAIRGVRAFAAGAPQEDDITLLAIRYRGPAGSA